MYYRASRLRKLERRYRRQGPKRLHYGNQFAVKNTKNSTATSSSHVEGEQKNRTRHIKKFVTDRKLISTQSIPKNHQNYLKFQQRLIIDETKRQKNETAKPGKIYLIG